MKQKAFKRPRNALFWLRAGQDWCRPRGWHIYFALLPSPEFMTRKSDEGRMTLVAWEWELCGGRTIGLNIPFAPYIRTRSDAREIAERLAAYECGPKHADGTGAN